MLELGTPVQYLKGVGPRIAAMLDSKGIATLEDLIYYLPFRYEDRLNPRRIAELRAGEMASLIGEVRGSALLRTRRMPIFELTVGEPDGAAGFAAVAGAQSHPIGPASGATRVGPRELIAVKSPGAGLMARVRPTIRCLWFHGTYLKDRFKPGQVLALYGKVEQDERSGRLQIIQPQFEVLSEAPLAESGDTADQQIEQSLEIGRIVPVYESASHGKLTSRWFRHAIHRALEELPELADEVPAAICRRLDLPRRRAALWHAHWPEPGESFDLLERWRTPAQRRLIFEELFFLELGLELKRRRLRAQPGIAFELNDHVREALKRVLPFHPTQAQKRVLKEIAGDMQRPSPMRRLLQGDVGSGKTIVALQAAAIAIENGYQAALMAPTEILATQHYLAARQIMQKAGYRVALLTGSLEHDAKRGAQQRIAAGDAQLVIGTHALLTERVEFRKLGLVIVDEQHRFGVMQRLKLMRKSSRFAGVSEAGVRGRDPERSNGTTTEDELEPDVLVMTATPIPRTLALTIYGDLDVSILNELPPGRIPSVTRRVSDERAADVWGFVRKQVAAGRQAYVVYPVIEGSDDEQPELDFAAAADRKSSGLKAAQQMYRKLKDEIFSDLRVGLLHGRLEADEKERVMRRFAAGEIDVLVSTTVIEVGVDVANASTMVIEHADRFGLSQLHQLRGRIGRGTAKSYCVLMTSGKITEQAEQRLGVMVRTNDGFEIAEKDLELRGPGEFFGTRQAGMPSLRVANVLRDRDLLELAQREARFALTAPNDEIGKDELARTLQHLKAHWQRRYGLVEVG
jgi:ATP-dependent DNA helicase RecG